jgi:hypothetical protein
MLSAGAFQQTISWRVLPEQGKRLTLDRGFVYFLSGCHFLVPQVDFPDCFSSNIFSHLAFLSALI